jgi:hypothetical protein
MNDDQIGHDLRAALEEQTPPPSDRFQDVLRRGTRRRLGQRLATGVVALVAVAGVGTAATLFSSTAATPMTPAAQPGSVDWPEAGLPAEPGLDGCFIVSDRPLEHMEGADPDLVERARGAIAGVAPDLTVSAPVTVGSLVILDLAGPGGPPGGVTVASGTHDGDPLTAADDLAHLTADCGPLKRKILDDGTVLQLYPVMTDSGSDRYVGMELVIFRPDGTSSWISVVNYASGDVQLDEHGYPELVGPGRDTLQLTEAQLAAIGLELANG